MSLKRMTQTRCACGSVVNVALWDSITVHLNPELKEGVMDNTLFQHQCSNCHAILLVENSLLFNDTKSNLMVWLCPEGVSNDLNEALDAAGRMARKNTRRRIVYTTEELREAIRIFDADLHDLQVQMVKDHSNLDASWKFEKKRLGTYPSLTYQFASKDLSKKLEVTGIGYKTIIEINKIFDLIEPTLDWIHVDSKNFRKIFASNIGLFANVGQ
jgi:hypothetical protein